jgi:hypothetical protein
MPEKNKIVGRIRGERKSPEELKRLNEIRTAAKRDFPPKSPSSLAPVTTGIGAKLREAREARNLTWYAVAKLADIPNPVTIRDIECGRDAKLSNIEAVAAVLGLKLDLVEV